MAADTNTNEEIEYLTDKYAKSNYLIGAKYRSTLLENKIMAICLSNIDKIKKDEKTGMIYSEVKASELKRLMNKKSGSFYDQLLEVAQNMMGSSIGISNPETKTFDYLALIIRATYQNGIFRIEYNPHMENYLIGFGRKFTMLSLKTMLSFSSSYSFRLYECLKSRSYYPKNIEEEKKTGIYCFDFLVSELKLMLGIVNAELDSVRRILNNSSSPDYDKAVEKSAEKTYEKWYEFKRKVLDPSIEEINDKTELYVKYDSIKEGRGGKVKRLIFTVIKKDEEKELTSEEKDKILDAISELIEEPLKLKDIRSIAEVANYDLDKIIDAYNIAKKSSTTIKNLTGFIKSAIKEEYEMPVERKGKKNNLAFNDFPQREYDYEQLELKLLSN